MSSDFHPASRIWAGHDLPCLCTLGQAYATLSDEKKRATYDKTGEEDPEEIDLDELLRSVVLWRGKSGGRCGVGSAGGVVSCLNTILCA